MSVLFHDVEAAKKSLKENRFYFGKWGKRNAGQPSESMGWLRADDPPHEEDDVIQGMAEVVVFLCDTNRFNTALDTVSRDLWGIYVTLPRVMRNKFTRALGLLATSKGFTYQEHLSADTTRSGKSHGTPIGVKLIAGDPFLGYLLRHRLFWKDSMDLWHGEHSHSLQWLAIAQAFPGTPWGTLSVPDLYACTADFGGAAMGETRAIRAWQWTSDCFPTSLADNSETLKNGEKLVSDSYRSPQVITDYLLGKATKQPIQGHFVSNYLFHRYKNRGWVQTRTGWNDEGVKFEEITKHYTGVAPNMHRMDTREAHGWHTGLKPNRTPNEARLVRTFHDYKTNNPSAAGYEDVEATFHHKKGVMRFYYHETV